MKDVSNEYIVKEEADQRKPAELYHFWRDGGEHWRHTSGDVTIVYDGEDYIPATFERTHVKYDSQLEVVTMTIRVAYVTDVILEYIAVNPIEVMWVSVMKIHRDQDPLEVDVVFIGQIKNVSFKGAQADVACVGFEQFLKQTIPRWRYQLTCNHILFDDYCTLSKASFKIDAVVTLDASKVILTSATFALQDDGYFIGGEIIFGVESRAIVAHVGSSITLIYKMKLLEDDDTVEAYPGCNGRIEVCRDTFSNVLNYLGFPFLPLENPAERIP